MMNRLSLFLLTILVIENLLFFALILLWINRHCSQCGKGKCMERLLNKICSKCHDQAKKIPKKTTLPL